MNRISKLTDRSTDERGLLDAPGKSRQETQLECDRLIHGLWEEMELQRSGMPVSVSVFDRLPNSFSFGSLATAGKKPLR